AGAVGVGAGEAGLDAVGLGERLADRVLEAGVGGGFAAAGPADGALVDGPPVRVVGHGAVHQRALARAGDAGDDDQDAEGDVDVDVAQVVLVGAADLQGAGRLADRVLDGGAVVEVAAGDGATGAQSLDGALEADGAARGAGAGSEVDDVVGDRDGLGLVLDDQDGVALDRKSTRLNS